MCDIIPTQCGGPVRPWRPQDDPLCPPCLAPRQSGRPASSSVVASSLLSPDTASTSGFMLSIDYRCESILFDCTSLSAAVFVVAAVSPVAPLLLSNWFIADRDGYRGLYTMEAADVRTTSGRRTTYVRNVCRTSRGDVPRYQSRTSWTSNVRRAARRVT